MENIQKWEEILEEIVQCCVCLEIPNSTISQCTIGHHICQFCRRKLEQCPLCKEPFIPARNLLAEHLISKIEDIKISIGQEIMEKLEDKPKCEKKFVDAWSQTNFTTVDRKHVSNGSNTMISNEKNTRPVIFYPCLMGSCLLKLSYRKLLQHLKERHRETFYEVKQNREIFSENFVIDIDKLPKDYDYAFHITNMGLFFVKITIHDNGELMANLQIVDRTTATRSYQYRLIITNGTYFLRRHGMVTSCLVEKEVIYQNSVHMYEKEMSAMIRNKSFDCTLIIKRFIPPKQAIDKKSSVTN